MNLSPDVASALDSIETEKAGFLPPFLTGGDLAELNADWERLFNDPDVKVANRRFIVDHKMYQIASFARLATHPVIQEATRRVIGDFQLAGYAVVATPKNSETPTVLGEVPFHVDHSVYSDIPVSQARDTFVCVWVNFEELAIENGPFALAIGTDKWNIGMDFLRERPGLTVNNIGFDRYTAFNVGPAGTTAVYSGKTWHAATKNCSDKVRRGLNMNFVPRHPLDSNKRNSFDVCALEPARYAALNTLIGIDGYLITNGGEYVPNAVM